MKPVTVITLLLPGVLFYSHVVFGQSLSASELDNRVLLHEEWLTHATRAGMTRGVKFSVTNYTFGSSSLIRGCNLSWAEFRSCTFTKTQGRRLIADNATFRDCKFIEAEFPDASFAGARFEGGHVWQSDFNHANFRGAYFASITVQDSIFTEASFVGASIISQSTFTNCQLQGSGFIPARLGDVCLLDCDLSRAQLTQRAFKPAAATFGDLSADIQSTTGCDLTGSRFDGVDFANVVLSVKPDCVLQWQSFTRAQGLRDVRIIGSRAPFVLLRTSLQDKGDRRASRELGCAIRRAERVDMPSKIVRFLDWAFFDMTCKYGSDFVTPLLILVCTVVMGAIVAFGISTVLDLRRKPPAFSQHPAFSVLNESTKTHPVPYYELAPVLKGRPCWHSRCHYSLVLSVAATTRFIGIGEVSLKQAILPFLCAYPDIDTEIASLRILGAMQAVIGLYFALLIIVSYIWSPFA